jgi:hypothetical protein
MRKTAIAIIVAGLLVVAGVTYSSPARAASAASNQETFSAGLAGSEVVPPVQTQATGEATFHLMKNNTEIHYQVVVKNINNVTMAHIHLGPHGQNGPIVVWLYPATQKAKTISGKFSGVLAKGIITEKDMVGPLKEKPLADLIADMRTGKTFVEVHTLKHPPGALRGTIR